MRRCVLMFAWFFSISAAAIAQDVDTTTADRIGELEKTVKLLKAELDKVAKRKPKLECKPSQMTGNVSNNPEAYVAVPEPGTEWQLVGGGCRFNGWVNGREPTLLTHFPDIDGGRTTGVWRCWGKDPAGLSLTAAVIYCRVLPE
jgi:hypothetical protein